MNYNRLEEHLFEIAVKKFAEFSKSLSSSDYISIGVKNPYLRNIIKEHINDNELLLEDFKLGKYLEVDFIYFGIALSRLDNIDEQLSFLHLNMKKGKSWAITDIIPSYLKKCSYEKYYSFFLNNYQSKYLYLRRLCFVIGLKFYKDKRILNILNHINLNEEYMVMMSEAWLLATLAINYPDEIYDYLLSINDTILIKKTISKITDSYRIKEDDKKRFRELRLKKP